MALSDMIFGQSPAKQAMPYLQKAEQSGLQQYNPYIQQGHQAFGEITPQYQRMIEDPQSYINEIMRSYTPSQGFKFQEDYLRRGMGNTAASGGYAGSPFDQFEQTKAIQGLLGTDMQNYLSNVIGAQRYGLEGRGNAVTQGFNASNNLQDLLTNVYGSQGTLAYKEQEQKNKNRADMIKAIIGAATAAATGGLTGTGGFAGALSGLNQYLNPNNNDLSTPRGV